MFMWMSRFSVKVRLGVLIGLAMVVLLGLGVGSLLDEREALLASRQEATRKVVESVFGVMVHFHGQEQAGAMTREQAQQAAIAVVKTLRYNQDDYFWINDMGPVMVMHPFKPALDGQDLSGFKDPAGKHLFVAFVDEVRAHGAGFVDYLWPKPGHDKPVPKISYVKGFQPWGWVVGSGIYIDDVDAAFKAHAASFTMWMAGVILLLALVATLVARSLTTTVAQVDGVVREMVGGNLTRRVPVPARRDEIYGIADQVNRMADSLTNNVRTVVLQSHTVNACVSELVSVRQVLTEDSGQASDLSRHVVEANQRLAGEIDQIRQAVGQADSNLEGISQATNRLSASINTIASASEEASTNVSTMASAAEQMSANVSEVNGSLDQVKHSLDSVGGAIHHLDDSLEEVRKRCQAASERSGEADGNAKGSIQVMERLDRAAAEIGKVVEVINSIAEQTNMLALNASIEAAGAGEAGKGFAVVANEVKELARQTADATRMISDQVEEIQDNTKEASGAVHQVTGLIAHINQANVEITQAVDQQGHSVREINRAMEGVADAAGNVTRNAQELGQAAAEVARAAAEAAAGTGEIARASAEVVREAENAAQRSAEARAQMGATLQAADRTTALSRQVREDMAGLARVVSFVRGAVNYFARVAEVVRGSSGALEQAQAGLQVGAPPFDVEKVKGAHMRWLDRLERVIDGRDSMKPGEVDTDHQCAFGKWYDGEGSARLAGNALFLEVGQVHKRVHELARQAVTLVAEEKREEAAQLLERFDQVRQELFRLLDRLYDENWNNAG